MYKKYPRNRFSTKKKSINQAPTFPHAFNLLSQSPPPPPLNRTGTVMNCRGGGVLDMKVEWRGWSKRQSWGWGDEKNSKGGRTQNLCRGT